MSPPKFPAPDKCPEYPPPRAGAADILPLEKKKYNCVLKIVGCPRSFYDHTIYGED